MAPSTWNIVTFLTYLLFLHMMSTAITSGHTATSSWVHPATAYTGLAACALVLGVCLGVSGLIMTITSQNNERPPEADVDAMTGEPLDPTIDILGPVFLGIGIVALLIGVSMCMWARYPPRTNQRSRAATGSLECADTHGRNDKKT